MNTISGSRAKAVLNRNAADLQPTGKNKECSKFSLGAVRNGLKNFFCRALPKPKTAPGKVQTDSTIRDSIESKRGNLQRDNQPPAVYMRLVGRTDAVQKELNQESKPIEEHNHKLLGIDKILDLPSYLAVDVVKLPLFEGRKSADLENWENNTLDFEAISRDWDDEINSADDDNRFPDTTVPFSQRNESYDKERFVKLSQSKPDLPPRPNKELSQKTLRVKSFTKSERMAVTTRLSSEQQRRVSEEALDEKILEPSGWAVRFEDLELDSDASSETRLFTNN